MYSQGIVDFTYDDMPLTDTLSSPIETLKLRVLKTLLVVGTCALVAFWQTELHFGVITAFERYAYPGLIVFYTAVTGFLFVRPQDRKLIEVITIWVLACYFVITHWLFFISVEYGLLDGLAYQQARLVQWYILIFIASFVFFEVRGALRSSVLFYLAIAVPEIVVLVDVDISRGADVNATALVALISNPVYIVCLWGVSLIKEHLNEVSGHATVMAEAASKDSLTGALNRRGLLNFIKDFNQDALGHPRNCALILLDVDHFKKINDNLGHDRGDETLIELTTLMKRRMRPCDHLARWGGEEFLIFAPDLSSEQSQKLAERLRHDLEEAATEVLKEVTASYGVHAFATSEAFENAVKKADIALYQAKKAGRNRVHVFSE